MQIDLFNRTPAETQTLAAGDLELWKIKDGRFLVHLTFKGKRNLWIELSAEQASWLAGKLVTPEVKQCCACGRSTMLSHICELCYERYVA